MRKAHNSCLQIALGWSLVLIAVTLASLWQGQARAAQVLDVGTALDEGYVAGFYGRELSTDGRALSFRWSRPIAELRLRPAPGPSVLQLRMLVPATPAGEPAHLSLSLAARPIADMALSDEFRRYQVLLPAGVGATPLILTASPLTLPEDPRALGLVLDSVSLSAVTGFQPGTLLTEWFVFPALPWGILLASAAVALAGGQTPWPGLAALAGLSLVALLAHWLPQAALSLAWSFTISAGAVALGLGLGRLARDVPALRIDRDTRAAAWLCSAWLLTFVTGFAPWVASDGTGYYAYTRSIMLDGDLNFHNEYREMPFPHTPRDPANYGVTSTGAAMNPFAIGPGLLWLPGFGLAHLFVQLDPSALWSADGYTSPYVTLALLTTALAGLGLLLSLYRINRRIVGPGMATLASLAVYFGANPLYYTLREGSFAHGFSALATALFVLAWLRLEEEPSPRRWAQLGLAAGFSIVIYWTSALVLIPAAFSFTRQLISGLRTAPPERQRHLRNLALGLTLAIAGGLLMVSPQLLAWQIIFGTPLTIPQGTSYITPGMPVLGPFFFASLHGMLPWTPAFFLGLIGLPWLALQRPWMGSSLLVGAVLFLLYNMSIGDWHGSGAFGLRRLTVLTPWFSLGLAVIFAALKRLHWSLPVAGAALMGTWTTMLGWRYSLYLIERDPGALADLPMAALLLGRDALPLDRAGDWIGSGFFVSSLRLPAYGAPAGPILGLLALVVALALGTMALMLRIMIPQGQPPALPHPDRRSEQDR